MDEIYRVSLFGHREIYDLRAIEEKLSPILANLLRTKQFVELRVGRNGEFDEYAASVIKRVQKEIGKDNNVLILVLPYTVKDMEYYEAYYDEMMIPECIGKAHPKQAITLRNRWLVETADLVIAYVERESGGAYKALRYAEKLNKKTINLAKKEVD